MIISKSEYTQTQYGWEYRDCSTDYNWRFNDADTIVYLGQNISNTLAGKAKYAQLCEQNILER